MKLRIFYFFFCLILVQFSFAQNSYPFYKITDESDISISAIANGGYKYITVNITNNTNEEILVKFPSGGFFNNSISSEQDLVNLFKKTLEVPSNGASSITLSTACANPKKAAPRTGRTNWSFGFDQKIGILLENYHSNRSMVELMTGAENHSTSQKRHNFLQMFVWVYYNADKKSILNFATKYIFDGDRRAAEIYVDIYYPIAKLFIDNYKRF